MKLSTRELATIAVFGTLWGLSEISLGSVLKSLNIPFGGAVLGAIGLIVALVGRAFVPKKGSTLFIGVIAMLLKLFSLGGVIMGPMVGIFSEALVAEIILSLFYCIQGIIIINIRILRLRFSVCGKKVNDLTVIRLRVN